MNTISSIACAYAPPLREPGVSEAVQKADPKNILVSGQLHPSFRGKLERLIERASAEGLMLHVHEGYRSHEAQAKIPASNTRAKPGFSLHNYGLAADLTFRDEKGRPSWDERHDWKRLGELGKDLGLTWGGDWKRLLDRPHFQHVPNDRLSEIRQLYQEGGLARVWESIQ